MMESHMFQWMKKSNKVEEIFIQNLNILLITLEGCFDNHFLSFFLQCPEKMSKHVFPLNSSLSLIYWFQSMMIYFVFIGNHVEVTDSAGFSLKIASSLGNCTYQARNCCLWWKINSITLQPIYCSAFFLGEWVSVGRSERFTAIWIEGKHLLGWKWFITSNHVFTFRLSTLHPFHDRVKICHLFQSSTS